jgi:hypothetical protein
MSQAISISFLPNQAGFLTLQKAAQIAPLSAQFDNISLELYTTGCEYAGSHGQVLTNCTEVCQDPAAVWNSMYTLHNCLAYPVVSGLLSSKDLDPHDREQALLLGYVPNLDFRLITEPVTLCVESFCHDVGKPGKCQEASYGNAPVGTTADPHVSLATESSTRLFLPTIGLWY